MFTSAERTSQRGDVESFSRAWREPEPFTPIGVIQSKQSGRSPFWADLPRTSSIDWITMNHTTTLTDTTVNLCACFENPQPYAFHGRTPKDETTDTCLTCGGDVPKSDYVMKTPIPLKHRMWADQRRQKITDRAFRKFADPQQMLWDEFERLCEEMSEATTIKPFRKATWRLVAFMESTVGDER